MTTFRIKKESSAYNVMDGEATVIHTETSAYYSLNEIGTTIWEIISDGTFTREEIEKVLIDCFSINQETASSDTNSFISKLKEADLAEEVADESSTIDKNEEKYDSLKALKSYEGPDLVKFGDLETLMLSGE